MRTRLPRESVHALTLALFAAAVTLILIAAGGNGSSRSTAVGPASWKGLAGSQRPRVAVGQRVIVLLKAPSLAERLGDVGGLATREQGRRWTAAAPAPPKPPISPPPPHGV